MNLAILHYHLNPGGVTRVIANHLLSLDRILPGRQRLRVLLMFDGQRAGWPEDLADRLSSIELNFCTIPSLGYQKHSVLATTALLDEVRRALADHSFGPDETVLHAHNHSLGKNVQFPAALRQLAEEGFALLLQPHDFAEDFRPSNFRQLRASIGADEFSSVVYFQGPRVHYATLNRRDFEVLSEAGIARDRLHLLPNPIPETPPPPPRDPALHALRRACGVDLDAEYVLYPVRGIRRKNVGEFVLLSVLRHQVLHDSGSPSSSIFGITLDPHSPTAIPYYERWKALAGELNLPCRFGVGERGRLSFPENLAAADRIVTTSVAEGFGMVFLESWLTGRGLVGRNLPEVTSDFIEAGLQLDGLYNRLNIPVEWVGRDTVTNTVYDACQHVYADYGLAAPALSDVAEAVDRATSDGLIDFGSLNEPLQEQVIRRVVGDLLSCRTLLDANPVLQRWDEVEDATIADNESVVRSQYSLDACGKRLRTIYHSLLEGTETSLGEPANGDAILAAFLDLDRFRLIRT